MATPSVPEKRQRPYDPAKRRAKYLRNKARVNAQSHAYHAAHKEQIRENHLEWLADHPDYVREYNKQYRSDNREKKQARDHDYYLGHKAEHAASGKAWKRAHPEKVRAYRQKRAPKMVAYHAAHKEQANARNRKRYQSDPAYKAQRLVENRARLAQKLAAPINDFTAAQWLEMQAACDHRCAYCGKRAKGKLTQDHITPLSQGGSHTLHNIVPACRSCNPRKGNRAVLCPVQPLLL